MAKSSLSSTVISEKQGGIAKQMGAKVPKKNSELNALLEHASWMNSIDADLSSVRSRAKREFFKFEESEDLRVQNEPAAKKKVVKPVVKELTNGLKKPSKKLSKNGSKKATPKVLPSAESPITRKVTKKVETKSRKPSPVSVIKETVKPETAVGEDTTNGVEENEKDDFSFFDWDDNVNIELGNRQLFDFDSINRCQDSDISIRSSQDFTETHIARYNLLFPKTEANVKVDSAIFNYKSESYLLVAPKDMELNPLIEIGRTMEMVALVYFPQQYSLEVINYSKPENCIIGEYRKAIKEENLAGIREAVALYNFLILKLQKQNLIIGKLAATKSVPSNFFHELLYQVYSRVVSPEVKKLRNYRAFSNNVYGELLPSFMTTIFKNTAADHTKKFLDLGSGVGNCVIQAALEAGCESYGVEIMEPASEVCESQLLEFQQRAKYYGVVPGKIHFFLKQSMIDNQELNAIIPDVQIVLVNNYVFNDKLNEDVGVILSALTPGAKIISLKNLIRPGNSITEYNAGSVIHKLKVEVLRFPEELVSWTHTGGEYFISTVQEKYQQNIWDHNLVRTRSSQ